MSQHDIVVIGASAGGLPALTTLVECLPLRLRAAVLVVMHTKADGSGFLPDILGRVSRLPVAFASHRKKPLPGHVYVAPPDQHLTLTAPACRSCGARARTAFGRRSIRFSVPPPGRSARGWSVSSCLARWTTALTG
jgi:chemotaxis response regulator CheB